MANACIWTVTRRDPYKLPPNTEKRECGKPIYHGVYCMRHYIINLEHSYRAANRQAARGSETARLLAANLLRRISRVRAERDAGLR